MTMADPMDLSLNDLITNKGRRRGGGGNNRGRQSNLRGPRRGDGGDSFTVSSDYGGNSSRGGGRRDGGRRNDKPYARGDTDGAWSHDLYDGPGAQRTGGGRNVAGRVGTAASSSSTPIKTRIENLHWNVTEVELWELMGTLGHPVKTVKLFFDNAGRSEGIAEVQFATMQGAQAAVKSFHGRTLDGMELSIAILPDPNAQAYAAADTRGQGDHHQKTKSLGSRLGPKPLGSVLTRLGQRLEDRLGPKAGGGSGKSAGGRSSGSGSVPRRGRGGTNGRNTKRPLDKNSLDDEMSRYMAGETAGASTTSGWGGNRLDLDKPQNGGRGLVTYDDTDTPMGV
ncbi:hypothetical protein DFS34DRAFT_484874 [Phlyctochytrium arcticum]|nr:hypothetical protein DFS34DRAFT_484874 [Phlyctochytrium arcticum]